MPEYLQLTVKKGPGTGLSFRLTREETHLGRGFENDISIDNQDVSRLHARLIRTLEGQLKI